MKYGKQLANEIKAQRQLKRLSQAKLAWECNLDPSYISKIENDKLDYLPSEEAIASLAQALNINEYQLRLWAGRIPNEVKPNVIDFLLAYPPERAKEILERHFAEAIG